MKKGRLGLEKEPDNFELHAPYVGLTPLVPRASIPNFKNTLKKIWLKKF